MNTAAQHSAGSGAPKWSSRLLFIVSAMGCTVGLGNIWRFPLVAGENGGGAFLLIYIATLLTLSVPLMVAELYLGRTGQGSPAKAIHRIASINNRSRRWSALGHFMAALGVIVLLYYPVIGSWTLEYLQQAAFGNLTSRTAADNQSAFGALMNDQARLALLHTLFLPPAAVVTALGVQGGLEQLNKFAMPLFLIIISMMLLYGVFSFGLGDGVSFLFKTNFALVTPAAILAAAGQALFSTAVGQGVLLTFASYLDPKASIVRYSVIICFLDAFVAILFGVFIFSVVGHYGLPTDSGSGLAYITLPLGFSQMPFGQIVATAFFASLLIAAFTSTVPSVDFVARWASDHFPVSHRRAALMVGVIAWAGGLIVIFSLDPSTGVGAASADVFGRDLLRASDYLAGNMAIPFAAFFLALFVGWRVKAMRLFGGADWPNRHIFVLWRFTIRFVTPMILLSIFILNL